MDISDEIIMKLAKERENFSNEKSYIEVINLLWDQKKEIEILKEEDQIDINYFPDMIILPLLVSLFF